MQNTPRAVFPEQRITKLLNSIRSSLGVSAGRPLTYEDLAMITGRSANTLADW